MYRQAAPMKSFLPSRGVAMWNIIINLIYEQSCERYLSEAFSVEAQAHQRSA
jgi:hypothetical protein